MVQTKKIREGEKNEMEKIHVYNHLISVAKLNKKVQEK